METGAARIDALTARLVLLEQRTADEAAAIRVELDELRNGEPAPAPLRPATVTPTPTLPPAFKHADLSWLAGPRGLAAAGGVVTLLGIIFLFALAASRGWIGPAVRCSIGGGVSALLVGAALLVRQRFGHVASALAAAGAGIGGLYVTIYAASRGYHLLDAGLVWAAVIIVAGLAVALALSWSSQLLAVLGLVAVVVAPPAVEGKLSGIGLGASAIAAAAALGLGRLRGWRLLGALAYGFLVIQTLVYVAGARFHSAWDGARFRDEWLHRGTSGLLACVVFALALAAAAAYQSRSSRLDGFSAALVSVSLPLALFSIWVLVRGTDERANALLVLAVAYAVPAAVLWLSGRTRGLAELPAAFALFAVALATATYLSNGGLLAAWTLEGLALTAVAVRLGRRRYQAAGLVYFAAAAAHAFTFETPLTHLFAERSSPAQHIAGLLLLVGALAVAALLLHGRELLISRLELGLAATAALLGLYAASLAVMQAAQQLGGAELHTKFQRGETLVSALWALVALAVLFAGLARQNKELRYGGLGLLGLALAKLFLFDLSKLSSLTRAGSFLAVGLALLAGGFLVQRLARNALPPGDVAPHL